MNRRWGRYQGIGVVRVDWLVSHNRHMLLRQEVRFIDRRLREWSADAGDVINGASVPWLFRRIFPAYIGRYRRATVVHDSECVKKRTPSWKVHRMFYEAMRCDGVGPIQAWVMWAAVRVFGPRFSGKERAS